MRDGVPPGFPLRLISAWLRRRAQTERASRMGISTDQDFAAPDRAIVAEPEPVEDDADRDLAVTVCFGQACSHMGMVMLDLRDRSFKLLGNLATKPR